MKDKEVKKIIICNATLMWESPSSVPREKYIQFSISGAKAEESQFVNAIDEEDCGLTEIARLLTDVISATDKIPEVMFSHEIDSFTVYVGGLFGRPIIPAEVWVLKPLKRKQRVELSKRLVEFGVSSDSLTKLRLFS